MKKDTNFQLYYARDPKFFEIVIEKEEPPYEFKIHIFMLDKNL